MVQPSKRVLLFEDVFLSASDVEIMLGDLEIEIVGPVNSLETAAYLARTEDLDGAILDVSSSDTTPVEPIVNILSERGIVVAFSSRHSAPNVPGGCAVLVKPFSAAQLQRVIGSMAH